jgi:hypothetical protein
VAGVVATPTPPVATPAPPTATAAPATATSARPTPTALPTEVAGAAPASPPAAAAVPPAPESRVLAVRESTTTGPATDLAGLEITAPPEAPAGSGFVVRVVARNVGVSAARGGVTISAPTSDVRLAVEDADGGSARVYRPGEQMAQLPCCGNVTLASAVAELWFARGWPPGSPHSFRVRVMPSNGATVVVLYICLALATTEGGAIFYPEGGEAVDQQGAPVLTRPVQIVH